MDVSLLMLIRALHILLGALWLGTAVLLTVFLMPSVRMVGVAGAPILGQLARRGVGNYILVLAVLTALTGLWLFWRVSDGLRVEVMLTPPVMVLGVGALCGLLAMALGGLILAPCMKGMGMAMGAASQMPECAERDAHLQRMTMFQARFGVFSKIVVTLMLIALLCMTITHLL